MTKLVTILILFIIISMIITSNSLISLCNKGRRIPTVMGKSKYHHKSCNDMYNTGIRMSVDVQPSPNETVTLDKNVIITISVNIIAVTIVLVFMSWQLGEMSSSTKMQLDAVRSEVSALNLRYDALGTAAVIVAGVFAILGNFAKVSEWVSEQFSKLREEKEEVKSEEALKIEKKSKWW